MLPISGAKSGSGGGASRDLRPIERLLASLALFRQVAATHVRLVAAQASVVEAPRGEVLARRGERMPGIVALMSGSAKLALRNATGDEKVVRFVGPGETFGEASALLGRACPVDMVALADARAVIIPAASLMRLLDLDSRFARNTMQLMAERFLGLLGELEATVQRSAVQRLAAYLDSLAEPTAARAQPTVHLPVSKTALAARLGMSKETLSRLLRELAERGLVNVLRRDIEIRDRAGLAQLAH